MRRRLLLTVLAIALCGAANLPQPAQAQTLSIGRGGVQYNGYGRGYYGIARERSPIPAMEMVHTATECGTTTSSSPMAVTATEMALTTTDMATPDTTTSITLRPTAHMGLGFIFSKPSSYGCSGTGDRQVRIVRVPHCG